MLRSVENLRYAGLLKVELSKTNHWKLSVGDGWKFALQHGLNYKNNTRSEMIPERKKTLQKSPYPGDPESSPWRPTVLRGGDPQSSLKGVLKENERVVVTRGAGNHASELSSALYQMFLERPNSLAQFQTVGGYPSQSCADTFPSGGVL